MKRWVVRAPVGTARYWMTLVFVVSRLGASRSMRLKMIVLGLWMPLRDRLFGPREARLRLRYGRLELPWVVGPKSDFEVLNEILVLRLYDTDLLPGSTQLVLDLGAHMGTSVLFWHERYPEARIVALEPDPASFRRLEHNVGALPGVEPRGLAVASEVGPVRFVPAAQGWVSSTSGEGEAITVQATTLTALFDELGPVDLLKIDIEGAERDALAGASLDEVRAIVGEYHDDGDPASRERFFAPLRAVFTLQVAEPSAFTGFAGRHRRYSEE